ncbi:MAG: efflux RND transporter permease subunit [Bacteroidales bacterium]|jgi:multidrug efflux pump|nr:efflux RND transporter permease subunit [Bacteroidales bacterium]
MSLSSLSIKKPVLSIVFTLLILIFGAVGFFYLGIREYPEMDPPVVTVTTTYSGANPEIIQAQITEPMEDAINGIEGIRVLSSVSTDQSSLITVEFNLGKDMESAANDVRDRVSKAIRLLPKDVDPPIVEKLSANANAIIFMIVRSYKRNIMEVNDLVENTIKERLQTISGVGDIKIFGEQKYSMRLWLDPYKMAAKGITSVDIEQSINRENIELPSGRVEGDLTELTIRALGLLHTPEQFNNVIIKQERGSIVRFSDIGTAELYPENDRSTVLMELLPVIIIGVVPQTGANNVAIANEFYKRMENLRNEIPSDYEVRIGYDFTKFERGAVKEVQQTIILSLILVVLIIFLFLRDWRSTIIPVAAIPVSIIGSFIIMAIMGLSINVLTLLAIVLAIGLVCDDAIVVLENIYTKIDTGIHPIEAALKGMKEIFFAVISTTITLAAVFLPIMFLQGLIGRLFKEFAIVVAGSVLISAFVALTLSPMMCSRILVVQRHLNANWLINKTEPFFLALNRGYRYSLKSFMNRRWLVFPVFMGLILVIVLMYNSLHSELAPFEDRSNIRIPTLAPEGSTYEFMTNYMAQVDRYIADSFPEASVSFSWISPSMGTIENPNKAQQIVYLVDAEKRKRNQHEIFRKMSKELQHITGIRTFPFEPPTIGDRFSGQPLQYVLLAPDLKSLIKVLPEFLDEARKIPILQFVDANFKVNKPELRITIDREKASQLGVSTGEIARTMQLTMSGQRYGYFIMDGKQYEIIGQVMRRDRDRPDALKALYVRNNNGELILLDNLIHMEESINPASIFSFNRYISATVSAGLAPGATLGDGIKALDQVSKKVLPVTFNTALAGQSRDYRESSSSLVFIFVLAIVLIFLILAAQFESFVDPLTILFTVPLALAGALFSLWYFNQTLNIFSEIGIIMLIGLVTKNGILIVEFANQRKATGLDKIEAVQRAAVSRFRPILMTSCAMMLGILPIALKLGASAESRQSLGIAVVGGLFFSTFLTLYMIPAIYSYLSGNPRLNNIDFTELTVEKKSIMTEDIS